MSDAAFDAVAGPPDEAALRETIRQRVEAAGTSFYWAMRLLPQERRDGMYAVYALCREVDDIADGDRPAALKLAALAAWRDEIEALYAGRPRQLVARALHEPVAALPAAPARISSPSSTAWRWTRASDIRAPDLADARPLLRPRRERGRPSLGACLRRCERRPPTASPTRSAARCSSPTSCATSTRTPRAAGSICRARSSIATAFATPIRWRCCAIRHCRRSAATSRRSPSAHFAEADAAMAQCRRRAMRPAAVMGAVYHATLRALLRGDWRDPAARVSLSRTAQALAGAAPRSGMSGRSNDGRCTSSAPASPGSPRRSRWRHAGRPVRLYEASAPCRRALPLLFRRRARLPHRQRQSSAALRQPPRAGAISSGSARATRSRDRDEAAFPFVDRDDRRALDVAAEPRRVAVVDLPARRGESRTRVLSIISQRWRCAAPAATATVAEALDRDSAAVSPAVGAARRRRAEHRRRRGLGAAVLARPARDPRPRRRGLPAAGAARRAVGELCRSGARDFAPARRRDPLRRAAARARLRRGSRRQPCVRRGSVELGSEDDVILAVPAPVAARLVPGLIVPDDLSRRSSTRISASRHRRRIAAVRRRHRRHRGVGVPQARGAVGDGQRRRPDRRPPGRGAAPDAVARRGAGL